MARNCFPAGRNTHRVPGADIYPAFERGAIDAVEFTAPAADLPLGLHRITPLYYVPGFTKPNGSSEVLVSRKAFEELDSATQAMIADVCASEAALAVAEMDVLNRNALATLIGQHGVTLKAMPRDLVAAARREIRPFSPISARARRARRGCWPPIPALPKRPPPGRGSRRCHTSRRGRGDQSSLPPPPPPRYFRRVSWMMLARPTRRSSTAPMRAGSLSV